MTTASEADTDQWRREAQQCAEAHRVNAANGVYTFTDVNGVVGTLEISEGVVTSCKRQTIEDRMKHERCGNCYWWRGGDCESGLCVRFPTSMGCISGHWCGEWRARCPH